MLTLPLKPPLSAQHITERLKLAASGCQSLALALFGAGVISPLFSSFAVPWWQRIVAALVAATSERAAMIFLRYIPAQPITRETEHDE